MCNFLVPYQKGPKIGSGGDPGSSFTSLDQSDSGAIFTRFSKSQNKSNSTLGNSKGVKRMTRVLSFNHLHRKKFMAQEEVRQSEIEREIESSDFILRKEHYKKEMNMTRKRSKNWRPPKPKKKPKSQPRSRNVLQRSLMLSKIKRQLMKFKAGSKKKSTLNYDAYNLHE